MTKHLHFGLTIILFLLLKSTGFSQSTFVHRAGSTYGDYGMSCSPTHDGGTIIAQEASTNGMDLHSGLIKCDASGNMQWYTLYRVGEYSYPFTVLTAKDEGYIVYAIASDSAVLNYNNYFLMLYKTNNNGITQWNKQISLTNSDLPLNMVYRTAGGYILFSNGDYNLGTYPTTLVTTVDLSGNVIWSKRYGSGYGLKGVKGIEMPDGNICFIATAGDPNNNFFLDVVVTMLDSTGNILWSKNFGTYYDDEPYALAANSSNDIFITGRSVFTTRNWDGFLIRLDQYGNKISSRVYDGGTSNGEIMRCIIANNDGTCRLLGDMGTFDERDITMLNIDSNLSVTAAHRYRFSPLFTNYPYEFYRATDGGLVFTGDYRPPAADRDAILVKTESDGTLPCFTVNQSITEYNEIFHDSACIVSSQTVVSTLLNYPDSIPFNPFFDHIVCALTADIGQVTDDASGNVFPNPASDYLKIDLSGTTNLSGIQLLSIDGREIENIGVNDSGKYSIDIRRHAKGIYFLRYVSDGNVHVKRIVLD